MNFRVLIASLPGESATDMQDLVAYLERVPAVTVLGTSTTSAEARWWVKLRVDVDHPLAWRVVQELGHVLNLLSVNEPLPTVFKPVSPPPYMNGGPRDFLSWVIEARGADVTPQKVAEWLDGRLPRPVDDEEAWEVADD